MTAEAKVILTAQDRTAAAFRSARSNLDSLNRGLGSVKNLLGTFGVGFSVAAIASGFFNAAKAAIDFGDEVQKAALRTGVSASEFGLLAKAAKQADVDIGTLSKGLRTMLVNVSEASTGGMASGPGKLLADLNINIEEFKKLKPQQQLEELADAIAALKDPSDRARVGTAFFSKAWEDFAPWLSEGSEGLRKATEEIKRMGGALTDEQYKKLGEADDAIKGLETSWTTFAQTLTAKVAPDIKAALDSITNALSDDPIRVGPSKLLDAVAEAFRQNGISTKWTDIIRQIQAAAQSKQNLEGAMWAYVSATETVGKTTKDRPSVLPPKPETDAERRARQKKDFERQFPDIPITAQRIATSAVEEVNKAIREQSLPQYQRDAEQWAKEAADAYAALATNATSPEQYSARLSELNDKYLEDIKITAEKILPPDQVTQLSAFAEQAARNMQDAFAEFFYSFDGGLKGMLGGFIDTIRKMAAQLLAQQILTSFFSWGSGLGGGIGKVFGALGKGLTGKAGGGPVMAGMPYKVGERGAEMFVPASNGMIIPNHAMGGGMTVHYNIDARGATQDVIKLLPAILEETSRRTVERTKAAVRDDIRRFGRVR